MDVHLAPPIAAVLHAAVQQSDTGYCGDATALRGAFSGFAARRWHWDVDPSSVRTCADVAAGVTEVLRLLTVPGDKVILTPPVYPPFWSWLQAVGATPVEVPLLESLNGGRLDLAAIDQAMAAGSKVMLLCSPHNPTGLVHEIDDLRALATLAARHDVTVLADEIHAPLTLPGSSYSPYLAVSDNAAATGIAFHSASKAWNLAGLKSALITAAHPRQLERLGALPHEVPWSVGHFGMLAAAAAYEQGESWLDGLLGALASNYLLLANLLQQHLPQVRFGVPQASYLAWLDCRDLGLGSNPAPVFLDHGRVAVSAGADFGPAGHGFIRLNIACHPDVLREAITRMAAAHRHSVT